MKLHVLHVIGHLGIGGAERMLERLCQEQLGQGLAEPVIISLTTLGDMGERMRAKGLHVEALGLAGWTDLLPAIRRLVKRIKELEPDVVQTWLYHADLVGGIAARMAGRGPVVWNIRCTAFGKSRLTGHLVRANARLSRFLPDSIICCGEEAKRFHVARGFAPERMTVLPNGFDVEQFVPLARPSSEGGCRFVAIGRADILKDYPTLIRAAAKVVAVCPDVRFAIYGRSIRADAAYRNLVAELGLGDRLALNDHVNDVREALQKADVYVSSSSHEGFPNVIAEAMLMQVPCVATAAGESGFIIGDTGLIVPTADPDALARAMIEMAEKSPAERATMGERARKRMIENFEIGHVARLYHDHYSKLIAG
jgi:glycosyltransferase involved in cell wall biosynthesis